MRTVEDYAYWLGNVPPPRKRAIFEAYVGTDVVGWQGQIERQLTRRVEEYSQSKNEDYANKLREYLRIWRANSLTGSINVETVNTLLAAADVLAVDGWKLGDYFSQLRDNLRKLKASAEQLPPVPDEMPEPRRKPRLVSQGTSSAPSTDFGPERETPANLEKEPGEEDELDDTELDKLPGEEEDNLPAT